MSRLKVGQRVKAIKDPDISPFEDSARIKGKTGTIIKIDSVGDYPICVVLGEVTNDSNIDIITANGSSDSVSVLEGNGSGGFLTHVTYPVGESPTALALGDLNGDNHTDIVTSNFGPYPDWYSVPDSVSVLLSNGSGGFLSQTQFTVGLHPRDVEIGDLNGDNKLD